MRRRKPRTPVQEERDAAARLRAWQKLELDALELYAHMMRQCASGARPPAGKRSKNKASRRGKGKAKKAAESEEDEEGSPVTPAKHRRQEPAPAPSAAAAAAAAEGGGGEGSAQAPGSAAAPAAAGGSSEKLSKEVLEAQVGSGSLLSSVGALPLWVGMPPRAPQQPALMHVFSAPIGAPGLHPGLLAAGCLACCTAPPACLAHLLPARGAACSWTSAWQRWTAARPSWACSQTVFRMAAW